MPSVDFYIISATDDNAVMHFACRLIDKAYRSNAMVHIHLDDHSAMQAFSNQLWTFDDISFLPHTLLDKGLDQAKKAPITLGCQSDFIAHPVLLNLSQVPSPPSLTVERVLEVVPMVDAWRNAARVRYKAYQQAGCVINNHDLKAKV